MFGNLTGFMSNDQVASDTKALQSYIEQVKNIEKSADVTAEKQRIFTETLKDSSQVAKDVAQNTNNLDDVMKVYTASTKTATSVAKAFGATKKRPSFLCQSVRYYLNDRLKVSI